MSGNNTVLCNDGPRLEWLYFKACQRVWDAIVFYRFKEPRVWRLRKILFGMGRDFALTQEQFDWCEERLQMILGK